MTKDQELEVLIQAAASRMIAATDSQIQRIEAKTLASLIMQRSPEKVAAMEREMGIEVV